MILLMFNVGLWISNIILTYIFSTANMRMNKNGFFPTCYTTIHQIIDQVSIWMVLMKIYEQRVLSPPFEYFSLFLLYFQSNLMKFYGCRWKWIKKMFKKNWTVGLEFFFDFKFTSWDLRGWICEFCRFYKPHFSYITVNFFPIWFLLQHVHINIAFEETLIKTRVSV